MSTNSKDTQSVLKCNQINQQTVLVALRKVGAEVVRVGFRLGGDDGAVFEPTGIDARQCEEAGRIKLIYLAEGFKDGRYVQWGEELFEREVGLREALESVAWDAVVCHYTPERGIVDAGGEVWFDTAAKGARLYPEWQWGSRTQEQLALGGVR